MRFTGEMSQIQVFRTVAELRKWRQGLEKSDSLGFVPTMGALHNGHLSLITASLENNSHSVVSIFVNPSQFAPTEDLDSYPRTFDEDYAKLTKLMVKGKTIDAIFAPTVSEMYPGGITLDVNLQKGAFVSVLGVSEQLEGKTRPTFFRGVATVVTKLFNAVQPDNAYFGQKDIQQVIVLKTMVRDLLLPVKIVMLPIVREETGLALSSRNSYLSAHARVKSAEIYRALRAGVAAYTENSKPNYKVPRDKILDPIKNALKDPFFKIDYVSLAEPKTLDELETVVPGNGAILSIASYVTENKTTTRLIDNIILE